MRKFFKRYILRDPFELEVRRWFRDRGDTTLRLDYPLDQNSLVIDVGGYMGDYAAAIVEKYNCQVLVFEPHPEFFRTCQTRFKDNDKVQVFDYGLSDEDGSFVLIEDKDGSSFENKRIQGNGVTCKTRKLSSVMDELSIQDADLIKINIEGGEYPLMFHIFDQGLATRFANFQIQFHNFIDNAAGMRAELQSKLEGTHSCTWNYDFVWENWERR